MRGSRGTATRIAPVAFRRVCPIEDDRVLRRQPSRRLEPGHDAEARQAGALGDDAQPVVEQARIAAELVDDVAAQRRPFTRVQDRPGADQAGDDAAAVDVGDEHDGNAGGLGEAHVGDVAVAQVDLRRAAGALDEHQVATVRAAAGSFPAPAAARSASAPDSRAPWRCRERGPAPPPARRSRTAA